jgi:hypothetical protein
MSATMISSSRADRSVSMMSANALAESEITVSVRVKTSPRPAVAIEVLAPMMMSASPGRSGGGRAQRGTGSSTTIAKFRSTGISHQR